LQIVYIYIYIFFTYKYKYKNTRVRASTRWTRSKTIALLQKYIWQLP